MEAPSIHLERLWVEYAVYGMATRSLKKTLARLIFPGMEGPDQSRVLALKDISLTINDGDRVGLVGGNGAGKTTLLRVLAGAMSPAQGRMRRVGWTSSLFDVSLGMNSEATGWDNILMRGLFLGLPIAEIRARTPEIVEFSGLTPAQLSRPVRTYSSGMLLRLAFSVSTAVHPDILLMDEWISVGDAEFLEKAHRRMTDLVERSRLLVIASHHDQLIRSLCNKAVYLKAGEMVAEGPVDEVLERYHQHG